MLLNISNQFECDVIKSMGMALVHNILTLWEIF